MHGTISWTNVNKISLKIRVKSHEVRHSVSGKGGLRYLSQFPTENEIRSFKGV